MLHGMQVKAGIAAGRHELWRTHAFAVPHATDCIVCCTSCVSTTWPQNCLNRVKRRGSLSCTASTTLGETSDWAMTMHNLLRMYPRARRVLTSYLLPVGRNQKPSSIVAPASARIDAGVEPPKCYDAIPSFSAMRLAGSP